MTGAQRCRAGPVAMRPGFSLDEVIVSMTMLAIVMTSLARLTYRVAEQGTANALITKRNFALQHEANRLGAMSFANLTAEPTGNSTVILADFVFTRTLSITKTGSSRYTIKIVVAPSIDDSKKDSVVIERSRPTTSTPLCTTC